MLLIVDDVYSSGKSIQTLLDQFSEKTRRNIPEDVRIAVTWCKRAQNRTARVPDYHLHETDRWLVLPYEPTGLTVEEISAHEPGRAPILDQLARHGHRAP